MFISDDPLKKIQQNLSKIQAAYAVMQHCFEQCQIELRKEFGEGIVLDTIDEHTKEAWRIQWSPLIEEQREEALNNFVEPEERGFKYVVSGPIPKYAKLPEQGFQDDFKIVARTEGFLPNKLNLSIWFNGTLCGLAASANECPDPKGVLLISLREGHPDKNHPLKGKIAYIIDRVSTNYAKALGHKIIAYRGPYSDGALTLHQRMNLKEEKVMISSELSEECYIKHVI